MDTIRKYKGKHVFSFLRNEDSTPNNEEEIINVVMQKFPRYSSQLILSAGCGTGGIASFIQNNGWGKVIGIDIEPESIEYAKTYHPKVDFHICDIVNIDKLFTIALFDIVSLFNVYHALHNPRHILNALQKVTKQGGHIAILDYLDLCENQLNPLFQEGDSKIKPFYPIKKTAIRQLLSTTGWTNVEAVDIHDKYAAWHQNLLTTLVTNKEHIIQRFDNVVYDKYYVTCQNILDAIQKRLLGGTIVYATRK